MIADRPTSRSRRLLDRLAGITIVLALLMAAMPATGLAGRLSSPAPDGMPFALLDLSQLGEALGRGELPVELLLAGALVALAVGLVLSLLVAALRQRRRRSVPAPDPAPAEPSQNVVDRRATPTWPAQDADVFRPASPPPVNEEETLPFRQNRPSAVLDAAQAEAAEAWAAREATTEAAPQASEWPPDSPPDAGLEHPAAANAPPAWERTDLPLPYAAIASIVSTQAPRADIPSARSALGTPEAPLVVELHDERETAARRRVELNLPLVAAIGTVAVGVAFSTGAAVGATLGVGVGAAIGLAFAGGAGAAIGATIALLGGRRR